MRFIDEYRDPAMAKLVLAEIESLAGDQQLKFMEVCGGHTHAIYRHGIEQILPPGIELVHGPGCPVCVIPMGRIDDAIAVAQTSGVIMATFGDMMRVPGSTSTLLEAKARGADVRMVYSPLDALELAVRNPDREVVFLAVGFETTAPSTAITVRQAKAANVPNFSVFCNHVTIVPPLQAILDSPGLELDGFLGPGHVSMVVGLTPFRLLSERYRKPIVVSGFEPLDILQSVAMLLAQRRQGHCRVENQYSRTVPAQGNALALAAIEEVFELRPHFEWRGLGFIPHSGLRLNNEHMRFDAENRFAVPGLRIADPKACQCGEVLKGAIRPWECKVFGTACTPQTPIGTCMVSSEGACAAFYNYGRHSQRRGTIPVRAR